MNKFLTNQSSRVTVLGILALFIVFGGYAAIDGDLQSTLIWGCICSVVIAIICVVNFRKQNKKLPSK